MVILTLSIIGTKGKLLTQPRRLFLTFFYIRSLFISDERETIAGKIFVKKSVFFLNDSGIKLALAP